GSGQRKLTTAAAGPGSFPASAAWSPDGQKIAFANRPAIYVIDADGSGLHRLTVRGTQPAWSPDGRTIAFARPRQVLRHLPDERRRDEQPEADDQRRTAALVVGRSEDRLPKLARREPRDLRHERRRDEQAAVDPRPAR